MRRVPNCRKDANQQLSSDERTALDWSKRSIVLVVLLLEWAEMTQVTRYHPVLVVLHWFLALLISASLTLGALVMAKIPNSDPMKLEALRSHMIGNVGILILMSVRLFVRSR